MTQREFVEFEATPSQKEWLETWCASEGSRLQAIDILGPPHTNPVEKRLYRADLPTDFRLRAPAEVLALLVKP